MQTRKLGSSELYLTTVGLGTWAIGGGGWSVGWGPQDDKESIATIRRALDLGINWIDTAPVYGLGHAEEIIGQAIAGRQDEVAIATKCGLVWDEGSTSPYGRREAISVRQEVEDSLHRLGKEVIDLYQIHFPGSGKDTEEVWTTIADLIQEGKVRYGGVCNSNISQLKSLQAILPVTSLQPPYSMIKSDIEVELLPYCATNNIGVITYSPMQSGLLTGKFTKEHVANLPDNDWRKKSTAFQDPELSATMTLVDKLRPIASRSGWTVAQLAIAWVLRRPELTAVIVGARRPSQIEETVLAGKWVLSPEDVTTIETFLVEREEALKE